jgi:HTH-type transcriptional regulator/antitoxin HipB
MDYPLLLPEQLTPYLKSLRRQLHLSQAELGRMLGVGQARMADIENNPGSVSVEQMMKVLATLDAKLVVRQWMGTRSPDADPPTSLTNPAGAAPVTRSAGALKAVGAGRRGASAAPAPARTPARKAPPKGSW